MTTRKGPLSPPAEMPLGPASANVGEMAEIRASVAELARRGGITSERAFAAWYAMNLLSVDEDAALEAAALDDAEDNGIDFLHVDQPSERVILLQGHFPENPAKAAPKAKFDALLSAIAALESPEVLSKAGRPDLAAAACEAAKYKGNYEFLVGLISMGAESDQVRRALAAVKAGERYQGYEFFYEAAKDIQGRWEIGDESVAEDSLVFENAKWFEDAGDYGRAYVGSVSASELQRLYNLYKEKLFARNVRLFLGTRKGGINEQIVATAKTTPGKFWALNNGITFVADTIAPKGPQGTFILRRFSIVNGCQTTVSLCRAEAPSTAKVLARVVAANQTVVNDIVRFNNTQNAVRIWTVRAADPIHEKLRNAFRDIGISYAPKPTGSRQQRNNVIELDRLAQFLASFKDTVVDAVREKSELFDRHYQAIFPHDLRPEDVYLAWLLGSSADGARQTRLEELKEQQAADKVQTALLGVAGTYWTVHCAARIVLALNPPPVRWNLKAMSTEGFQNALRKYVLDRMDIYMDLSIDSFNTEEYTSVRQALRSPKFLQKLDQKLANRVARIKSGRNRLPSLEGAAKAAKGK